MPKDRYGFDAEFDINMFDTHMYDDTLLSTDKDEKITARREARKAKLAKNSDVNVITPEDIDRGRKVRKHKARTSNVILVGLAFVAVMFVVIRLGIRLVSLEVEKKAAQAELASLELKVEQLEAELKELDSEEYIENAARSELHMIKNGEVMYIVDPGTEETKEESAPK